MSTQRIIIRTCDACAGTKKNRSDLPRYQWFFLIGVVTLAISTFQTRGDCGRRRILESVYESTNDEAPFVDEIPHADSDDR